MTAELLALAQAIGLMTTALVSIAAFLRGEARNRKLDRLEVSVDGELAALIEASTKVARFEGEKIGAADEAARHEGA